ncbi:hypothetical protein K437DRAFT_171960 [Tilletiaria anomala UBC 951]|uniref:Uncharacterized protein n=1 Tax=Tilletiaria anomala (strain ATCC 24038 / CBS 436.72 / UBC 951) TaxID=1037660 RepID=A0A066VIN4_TILAU|nr:uncharacterized protein K437DRAFT_171960 [Tilletiaria anomala UBC 951]KDN41607.1 hypothetical protein K437DRAFT_171960 [Tilletiaria anomala UBC 951]
MRETGAGLGLGEQTGPHLLSVSMQCNSIHGISASGESSVGSSRSISFLHLGSLLRLHTFYIALIGRFLYLLANAVVAGENARQNFTFIKQPHALKVTLAARWDTKLWVSSHHIRILTVVASTSLAGQGTQPDQTRSRSLGEQVLSLGSLPSLALPSQIA